MEGIALVAHVLLTTAGYAGLIAADLWLLFLCRGRRAIDVQREAVRVWRRTAQLFGPTLGLGALVGLALAFALHEPLAPWLIATYVLIVVALGTQAAVMIPWQVRADAAFARGASVTTAPIGVVLGVLIAAYASILVLMLLRPG